MMKYTISVLLLSLLIFSCANRPSAEATVNVPTQVPTSELGELINTIEFEVKAPDAYKNDYENGIAPWISIESPENEIENLIDADETLIPDKSITLIIDYPLDNPATFDLKSEKGFSRKQLILEISKKYHEIYTKEESSATIKTIPIEKREGFINRNKTNGEYGIWGHDLSDLDLSQIEVYKNSTGKIQIVLGIES